jgi:hypothetical protein
MLDKIKKGSKVRVLRNSQRVPHAKDGPPIQPGQVIEVIGVITPMPPAIRIDEPLVVYRCPGHQVTADGTLMYENAGFLFLSEVQPLSVCVCPLNDLIAAGCSCGAMIEERKDTNPLANCQRGVHEYAISEASQGKHFACRHCGLMAMTPGL